MSDWANNSIWHVKEEIKYSIYSQIISNQGVQVFDIYKNNIQV